jgi:hypothetical protein
MIQNTDTNTKMVEINYLPLFDNLAVQNMIVKMHTVTSEIKSVYAVIKKKTTFGNVDKTILYMPGKLIQVVETEYPFSGKPKKTAKELFFELSAPQIEITNELDKKYNNE